MKKLILTVPGLIVLSIAATFVLLLLGLWLWAIGVLVFAFILNCWSETFALHLLSKNIDGYDFRVLTFNVNRANEVSVNKGSTDELIDLILQQDADIVLLQEYNTELYPSVQERLGLVYPYGNGIDSVNRFKSVFSRFPIESCEQIMIDSANPQYELFQNALYCKKNYDGKEILPICNLIIRIGERRLHIFNCHLMSNNYSVVIRNLRKKGKRLWHGILSIIQRMDFGYQARELQTEVLVDHIEPNIPTLVCGDFNDIGGSVLLRRLQKEGFCDAWWKGGFGFGFTFHGMGLRLRLDHVLYTTDSIKIQKVSIPHSNVSDHDPLICDLFFKSYP